MIHILFATETGNAESIADDAKQHLTNAGHEVSLLDMDETILSDLETVETCLAIVSTWGDGDPPSTGETFYNELRNADASYLKNLRFCVYALGDLSYENFCQFGKNLDATLEEKGAHRMLPCVENDVDFEENFDSWIEGVTEQLSTRIPAKV